MITFWWIRHAPVVGNNNCCYGNNEVECDLSDSQSFEVLAKKMPSKGIVYTSGLSRAIKTFHKLNAIMNLKTLNIVDERLEEQNLGKWTGLKYDSLIDLAIKNKCYSYNWLIKPGYKPPCGETFNNLVLRVKNFINDAIKKYDNENILIFSHGGPIRAALTIALELKSEDVININIDNTKLTKIEYMKGKWLIRSINE